MRRSDVIRIALLFPFAIVSAQTDTLMEQRLGGSESETPESEALDLVQWLLEHPVDLNSASYARLREIPGLPPHTAASIVRYRQSGNRFHSVDDLVQVNGINPSVIEAIRPFIIVTGQAGWTAFSVEMRTRVIATRDDPPLQERFPGSPYKTYTRLSVEVRKTWDAGVLVEKDAGERESDGFLSGFIGLSDWGPVSRLVVGDYTVHAGSGLVLGRRTSSRGNPTAHVSAETATILPHRSTDEFHFLRGGAVEAGVPVSGGRVSAAVFWSRRRLPATVADDGTVSGFPEGGLFRTSTELRARDNVSLFLAGTVAQYVLENRLHVGISLYRSDYDRVIKLAGWNGQAYQGIFSGGVNTDLTTGPLRLHGEVALQSRAASAFLAGVDIGLGNGGMVSLVYRQFHPAHTGLQSAGPGERDEARNERGLRIATALKPESWLRLQAGTDLFTFPAATPSLQQPSTGHDLWMELVSRCSEKISLTLRCSQRLVDDLIAGQDALNRDTRVVANRRQQRLRLTTECAVTKEIRWKFRVELSKVRYGAGERSAAGFLIYQDLQYRSGGNVTVDARLIFFHTDSYESRIYEFENDLRGVFYNPALFEKGRRWYVLLRCPLSRAIAFSAKYSETGWTPAGAGEGGRGATEVSRETRVELQFDFRL